MSMARIPFCSYLFVKITSIPAANLAHALIITALLGLSNHPSYANPSSPSVPLSLSEIQTERHSLRDRLNELEELLTQDPANAQYQKEVQTITTRMGVLANEITLFNQRQITLQASQATKAAQPKPSKLNLKTAHTDPSFRDLSDDVILELRRYEAFTNFLPKFLKNTVNQLNVKIQNTPLNYDNRHFTFLRKERPVSAAAFQTENIALAQTELKQFQNQFEAKIHALPQLTPPYSDEKTRLEIKNNLIAAELLKTSIVIATYQLEATIHNMNLNLIQAEKLKPELLKLFRKKINATYKPHGISAEESLQLQNAQAAALTELANTFDSFLTSSKNTGLAPQTFKEQLIAELQKVSTQFNEFSKQFIKDQKGTFKYVNQLRNELNVTFNPESLIRLLNNDEVLEERDLIPFPFFLEDSMSTVKLIEKRKIELLKELENGVLEFQLGKKTKTVIGPYVPDQYSQNETIELLPKTLEELTAKHQEKIKQKLEELISSLEVRHYGALGRNELKKFKALLEESSPKSALLDTKLLNKNPDINTSSFLQNATNLQMMYDREVAGNSTAQDPTHWRHLRFAKLVQEMDVISNQIKDAKFAAKRSEDKILETKAQLQNDQADIRNELKAIQSIAHQIEQVFPNLKTTSGNTLLNLKSEFQTLNSQITDTQTTGPLVDPKSIQIKLTKAENTAQYLKNQIDQFKYVMNGILEISDSIQWSITFRYKLNSLNKNVSYAQRETVKIQLDSFESELRNNCGTIEILVGNIERQFELSGSFGGEALKVEMEMLEKQTHTTLQKYISSLSKTLADLSISYEDLTRPESLWRINNPSETQLLTAEITSHFKSMPRIVPIELVQGWRNFAGYVGLSLTTCTQSNASVNKLSEAFRDLNSIIPPLPQIAEVQQDHYRPLFSTVDSKSLPGLRNFGATCYLNSITKALETTGLQKIFSPTHTLMKRSYESNSEFNNRIQSHKTISIFMETLSQKTRYEDQNLPNIHLQALDALGSFLKPTFGLTRAANWMGVQQDAEEALGEILNKYEGQENSFWKIGMGQLLDARGASKDNLFSLTWERGLPLSIHPGFSSVQALLQKDLESTTENRTTDDGRNISFLKRGRIIHAPDTLIVQLKRFAFDENNGVSQKIFQPVDFMSELNLFESEIIRDHTENPKEFKDKPDNIRYRIQGAIYHLGTSGNSGHYIYASFESNGDVVVHNDTQVTLHKDINNFTDLQNSPSLREIADNAYLLFFERI